MIRRLYDRDHLDQVLATFALILMFSEGTRWLFGSFPLYLDIPPLLQGAVALPGGTEYPVYRLAIILAGTIVAFGLYLLISRTRLGMRIRAGESDREMIGALGVDIRTLYTVVFALGAALAGLAGAMVGALQSVQVGMGEPVLILAFVVIVIGGIGSIKGALLGALLVGVTDTMGRFLLPKILALFVAPAQAGMIGGAAASMLIYIVMAVILAVKPRGLFPRRMREMMILTRENLINLVLAALLLAVPFAANALGQPFYITLATRIAILALAATGLNLALGLGGLVSFGHAAFFGIGGYVAGILASHAFSGDPLLFGLSGTKQMWVIWIVALALSGLVGLAIGAISLRTSGVYFIMITLAFAQMVYYFAVSWPAYGGEDGLSILVRNQFPGVNTMRPLTFFLICYVVLLLALGLFALIRASRFGTALQAARQNEVRVATVGIQPYRIRLTGFAISAAVTGLAGALFADLNRFVSPSMLSWHMSGEPDRADHPRRHRPAVRAAGGCRTLRDLRICARRPHRTLAVLPRPHPPCRRAFRARRSSGPACRKGQTWLSRFSRSPI